MKRIGLRNIKTAISVMVTMIILNILGSDSYFYACIAAAITMQVSVYESFKAGKNRMIGTTIGVIIGILFAMIQPANILLVGIGIITVIYLCDLINYKPSISIGCIVFIAIMVNLKDVTAFDYGINRLFETLLGIAVTVAVNYVIVKNESTERVLKHYNKLKDEINEVFKSVILNKKNDNFEVLKNHIIQFQNLINSLEIDCNHISNKEFNKEIDEIRKKIELFKEVNIHIKVINYMKCNNRLSEENINKLNEVFPEVKVSNDLDLEKSLESIYNQEFVVYNYHIDKIINILQKVNTPF